MAILTLLTECADELWSGRLFLKIRDGRSDVGCLIYAHGFSLRIEVLCGESPRYKTGADPLCLWPVRAIRYPS